MSQEAQIRHIYERWHATLMGQDLAGLMALYAEHAVFESPTVLAQFPDRDDGILRGRGEIEKLFARNFSNLRKPSSASSIAAACSSPTAGSSPGNIRGSTPRGAQVDLFKSMDIENGLIVYHRVYWGWQGLKALLAVRRT